MFELLLVWQHQQHPANSYRAELGNVKRETVSIRDHNRNGSENFARIRKRTVGLIPSSQRVMVTKLAANASVTKSHKNCQFEKPDAGPDESYDRAFILRDKFHRLLEWKKPFVGKIRENKEVTCMKSTLVNIKCEQKFQKTSDKSWSPIL